jgi:predicted ester cyclase
MSIEENKEVVRRFVAEIDEQNLDALHELVAPDLAQQWRGRFAWNFNMFPGHRAEIVDMLAEGDQVWVRLVTSGGYAGGWMGIPASDVHWTNTGVYFYRLKGGKIVEGEGFFNVLEHLKQLGAEIVPPDRGRGKNR